MARVRENRSQEKIILTSPPPPKRGKGPSSGGRRSTIGGFRPRRPSAQAGTSMGETNVGTRSLDARRTGALSVWIAVIVVPLFLVAPALWNGYPLLEWDTGGYLARWYEGYLVPSRSTVFGLYLHYGEGSGFWLNLGVQALATLWILQLSLRVLRMGQPFRLMAIGLLLMLTTALPWLASMLLTDIFAGLSVLSLFILIAQGHRISSKNPRCL